MADEKKTMGTGLELWERVEKTNPKFTKKVDYGQKHYTAVDAYWQIKVATELWGPFGSTWGVRDTQVSFIDTVVEVKKYINNKQEVIEKPIKMAVYKTTFYYPGGAFPIGNAIKVSDDEFMKKLETDTITKALSRLGFSADVFLGYFDDTRYVNSLRKQFAEVEKKKREEQQQQQNNKQNNKNKQEKDKKEEKQPTAASESKPDSQPLTDRESVAKSLKNLGLSMVVKGDAVIASGKTYGKSEALKKLGFRWNADTKTWVYNKAS